MAHEDYLRTLVELQRTAKEREEAYRNLRGALIALETALRYGMSEAQHKAMKALDVARQGVVPQLTEEDTRSLEVVQGLSTAWYLKGATREAAAHVVRLVRSLAL